MKLNDFKKTIKESLQVNIDNRIHNIDVSPYLQIRPNQRNYNSRLAFSVLSIFILLAITFSISFINTPVTTLTIDINPSIKVDVNAFNRVVSIEGINADGEEFVNDLEYKNKKLNDFLDELKVAGTSKGYFTETEAYLLVGIYSTDYSKETEVNDLLSEHEYFNFLTITKHLEDETIVLYDTFISQDTNSLFSSVQNAESSVDDTLDSPSYGADIDSEVSSALILEYQLSETKVLIINTILDAKSGDESYLEYLLELSIEELITEYNSVN